MDTEMVKHQAAVTHEFRCMLCGAHPTLSELCDACASRGLSAQQYAEFFWEEA